MKRIFIISLLSLIMLITSANAGDFFDFFRGKHIKGSGDITTEEREIDNFEYLKSTGSFDIIVNVGEEPTLKITFDDNLIDIVETEVRGKTLTIKSEGNYRSRRNCLIEITVPQLEHVKLSGSGDIEIFGLEGELFELELSGSGEITAEGQVEELEVKISGSGDIDTRDLKAADVYARVSGSGDIKVYASKSFEGRVSGSGDIYYYGNPKDVDRSVTGSGRIRKKR